MFKNSDKQSNNILVFSVLIATVKPSISVATAFFCADTATSIISGYHNCERWGKNTLDKWGNIFFNIYSVGVIFSI